MLNGKCDVFNGIPLSSYGNCLLLWLRQRPVSSSMGFYLRPYGGPLNEESNRPPYDSHERPGVDRGTSYRYVGNMEHRGAEVRGQPSARRSSLRPEPQAVADDLVRNWLAKTERLPKPDSFRDDLAHVAPAAIPWRPFNLPIPATANEAVRKSVSRQRRKSHGSSFLASPCKSHRRERTKKPVSRTRRHPSLIRSYEDGDVDILYQKRPRHKTREDKYSTVKNKAKADSMRKQMVRPARRTEDSTKAKLRSGSDIINKFTSEAVLSERLTVHLPYSFKASGPWLTCSATAVISTGIVCERKGSVAWSR
jgi:hypothetical protein